MIKLKTAGEIAIMFEGGKRLRAIIKQLKTIIKAGITTEYLDQEAEKLIKEQGGEPSFKKVKDYHWSICTPINEQVVHTPPAKRTLKTGDLLTIDLGMLYQGMHTDYADTLIIGEKKDKKINDFLLAGKIALDKAIRQAKINNYLGQISQAIESEIKKNGYFILKELTGHGIGKDLHEDPFVFGYLERPIDKTPVIKSGLTIAIEVIYSMTTEKIAYEKGSNWSIITADHSLSACFEKTIAVTSEKSLVLT